jgi:CYTH domain-containing protein
MSLEIEKRFKNYDYKTIKKIVQEKCNHIGSYIYTFTSYEGIKPGQSIRIRDEGSKITFTVKQKNENNYDTEWEVIVNDYKMIDGMLTQMNISKKYEMQKFIYDFHFFLTILDSVELECT